MANRFAQVSFQQVDGLGVVGNSRIPFMIDDTKTVAQLAAGCAAIGDDFAAVTDTLIQSYRVEIFLTPSSDWNTGKPAEASRIEQTGLLNFNNATTHYAFGIDIAGLADDMIAAGKIVIDTGAMSDFIALLLAGISGDGIVFVNTAQQALTSLRDALVSFRKHRAATDRRTKVVPGA